MRASFLATVRGVSETDTSGFCGGAHAVEFYITGKAPVGEAHRKVTLPLFDAEQARELAAVYHKSGAVRITVELAEGGTILIPIPKSEKKPIPPIVDGRPSCCEAARHDRMLWSDVDAEGVFFGTPEDNREVHFCPFCGTPIPEVS